MRIVQLALKSSRRLFTDWTGEGTSTSLTSAIMNLKGSSALIKCTANFWPEDNCVGFEAYYHRFAFICVRTTIISCAFLAPVLLIVRDEQKELIPALVTFTVFMDIISVLPAQYLNQLRMRRTCSTHDRLVAPECVTISLYFGLFCAVTIFISIIIYCFGEIVLPDFYVNFASFVLVQVFVAQYLTFNMFFLTMDLKVSANLVDQLSSRAERQEVTVWDLNQVREEIHSRVRKARWATDLIVAPCLASVATIVASALSVQCVAGRADQRTDVSVRVVLVRVKGERKSGFIDPKTLYNRVASHSSV